MSKSNLCSIHSVCRICLEYVENDVAYDLFVVPDLAKKLQLCTSLTVEPQDGFPKSLCEKCYDRLNDLHDFQRQCVDSIQKFQELLSNNAFPSTTGSIFDISIAGNGANLGGAEEDERLTFDPLLNHKMEIDNEDDVFKMLESVEKEAEDVEKESDAIMEIHKDEVEELEEEEVFEQKFDTTSENKEPKNETNLGMGENILENEASELSSSDYDEDDDDINDDEFRPEEDNNEENDESDDDLPLAVRLRNLKSKPSNKSGKSSKRKCTAATEYHSHRIIECHICHKKFKKAVRYQEHMRYHNDKLPYQCNVESCLKGFTTANGLRLHVEHCHAETVESIPCPEEGCGRTFPRRRLLNWHLKKVHKIVKELNEPKCYPCTECEKVFRCPMALKKHMYKHDGKELPFPCNICGKRFVINSALKDHLMRHAGIKNYVCPYCGVGKTTRQEWNTHINTHTQEKKFKCHLCPHASHNKQNLRMHVKIVHEKIKDYACQYCGKTFGKSNACKMHEMTHTGEKRCECKVCGKRFLYAKGLTKHLKTHEKRVLRAIEVYRKRQLERGDGGVDDQGSATALPELPEPENNSKETHAKVAEEILKVCAESAASVPKDPRRVERVDISQLAGTAVNPIPSVSVPSWSPQINFMMKEGAYICPDCGQGFNAQGNLKRHHRIVHEGVKDFACRFCHRRFAKAQTLKHHEMTHTGEKPHECTQCGKRFIQYVALKRHFRVHLPKPPPTIPSSVYHAREELQLQEREKLEAKRKAAEARAAIAKAANKQLEEINLHQEELRRMVKGPVEGLADPSLTESSLADANDCDRNSQTDSNISGPSAVMNSSLNSDSIANPTSSASDNELTGTNSSLGDFPHINTSTMGMRTVSSV